ncbi:hypothetical protein CC2G_014739 [Coprinopsis cinerea AmutBmut pab1-1]|nr:hypothetical protein CC2G_014739 [Coprinopsis cinerea AmutBmut pab1-1]
MSMPPLPLSMSDVDLTLSVFPSSSTILLSLLAVFILTSFVRALWIGLREHLALVKEKRQQQQHSTPTQSLTSPTEKSAIASQGQDTRPPTSSWLWGLLRLSALRAPPSQSEECAYPSEKQAWSQPQFQPRRPHLMSQVGRRTGPAFDRPLPTLYESDIPVSMAKMIMSRHTFRRPSSRPPPARSASSIQIQRKTPMLPPQASSSLSRPATLPPSRSPSPPSPTGSLSRSPSRSPSPPRLSPPPPVGPSSEDSLRSSGSIV